MDEQPYKLSPALQKHIEDLTSVLIGVAVQAVANIVIVSAGVIERKIQEEMTKPKEVAPIER